MSKQILAKIKENAKEVKTWPKWKQNIVIDSEAMSTGRFIKMGNG